MEVFKAGDVVEVIYNNSMNAAIGTKAIVKNIDGEYLNIEWPKGDILDKTGNLLRQSDGGYLPGNFKKINKDWDD